jgi:hypothetical protein
MARHDYHLVIRWVANGTLEDIERGDAQQVAIYFDWNVRVRKLFVRHFGWLLRPCFVSNHRSVVARGEESLDLELMRRRHGDSGAIPAPPGPTFPHGGLGACVTSSIWSLADLLPGLPERVRES